MCPKSNSLFHYMQSISRIIKMARQVLLYVVQHVPFSEQERLLGGPSIHHYDHPSFLLSHFAKYMHCMNELSPLDPPKLSDLCVNVLRGLKQDYIHLLPLSCNNETKFYQFSYDAFMRQQNEPHIKFCTHPVVIKEHRYKRSFGMILDLHLYKTFDLFQKREDKNIERFLSRHRDDGRRLGKIASGLQPEYTFIHHARWSHYLKEMGFKPTPKT